MDSPAPPDITNKDGKDTLDHTTSHEGNDEHATDVANLSAPVSKSYQGMSTAQCATWALSQNFLLSPLFGPCLQVLYFPCTIGKFTREERE